MKARLFVIAVLTMIFSLPATAGVSQVWVATGDAKVDLFHAWKSDAEILDYTPHALILGDAASASALAGAGYSVSGPFALDRSLSTFLVHSRDRGGSLAGLETAELPGLGIDLIWMDDHTMIVQSDGPADHIHGDFKLENKLLRDRLVRQPVAAEEADPRGKAQATTFEPIIQEMVDLADSAAFMDWIVNLTGDASVMISGSPYTLTTRYTSNAQCDTAERYIYEQFQAMGFTDVQFDPFSFSGTNARNVVATMPGSVTPNNIYIIGGHLDSRSTGGSHDPAPGANDNASGVAGVMEAARILKDYEFESTIKFIAFTGEEQGLYGSDHYSAEAASSGDNILGVVITDMIAYWDNNWKIDIEGETPYAALMMVMKDACDQFTNLASDTLHNSWGSDHVPFQQDGFPAFLAIEDEYGSYPCYHQACDETSWNDGDFGKEVTQAMIATVAHLAKPLGLSISHTPLPDTDDTVGPYDVVATITSPDALVPASLELHYSTGGSFTTVSLSATGNPDEYSASIPGQPANTTISYYLSADDTGGRSATNPGDAPTTTHDFVIGSLQTLFFEDFESGAAGWSHGGSGDEWQVGAPQALAEDPSTAYAGTNVYGLDLTGLGSDTGKYEDYADTWLESPVIDCTDYSSVKLSLQRWLAIERSNGQQWDWAQIQVNGNVVWESPSGANLVDNSWVPMEIDISSYADNNPSVKIRFTLESDVSVTFGGWNLDNVTVTGIGPPSVTDVAEGSAPRNLVLHGNRPNPFNPTTTIRFELPVRSGVDLTIHDPAGRLVKTLVSGELAAGPHAATWNGQNDSSEPVSSGIYFYKINAGAESLTKKMILIR